MSKQATFTEMLHGTAEDYAIIAEEGAKLATQLPDRILEHLDILKGETAGFAVDRYEPVSYTHLTLPTILLV